MKTVTLILKKSALVLSLLMTGYLAYNTMHYTYLYIIRDDAAIVTEAPDSRLRNLVFVAVVFALFFLFQRFVFKETLVIEKKKKALWIFLAADLIITAAFLFIYISKTAIPPYWDQAQVYNTAGQFLDGNYSALSETYFHKFPQQLGLIVYEEFILLISRNYIALEYANIVFILLIILGMFLFTYELFKDEEVTLYAVLATTLFVPLGIYSNFIYGEIPSIAGCVFIAYLTLKWINTNRLKYPVIAVILSVFTLLVRENVLIFYIAEIIVLLLCATKQKAAKNVIFALLLVALPLIANLLVKLHYEKAADTKLNNGIPAISWIVMGLNGDPDEMTGVGYYDGYNEGAWWIEGATTENAKIRAKNDLAERIDVFKSDLAFTRRFFRYKILEQWIEPTFDAINMTDANHDQAGPWVETIYSDQSRNRINNYMNRYLTIFYVSSFAGLIFLLVKKENSGDLIMPITFIGGFLFSILWEAKGRYTLPYAIFMLPMMAYGLKMTVGSANKLITKIILSGKARRNGESN